MKNKKAFTLVEVLAVIVIIGILSTTVVAAISSYMQKGKDAYNEGIKKTLLVSGKNYFAENKTKAPDGNKTYDSLITVKEMLSKDYLSKQMTDAYGNDCSNSFVIAHKDSYSSETEYTPCLRCGDKNYDAETGGLDENDCETMVPSYDSKAKSCTIDYDNEKITLTNEDGSGEINFKKFKICSGNSCTDVDIDGGAYNSLKEAIINLQDGNYEIKAVNKANSTVSCGSVDLAATCEVSDDSNYYGPNQNIDISYKCVGASCRDTTLKTKTVNASSILEQIEFSDKFDRSITCTLPNYKIDDTNPTCGNATFDSTDNNITVSVGCSDDESGCNNLKYIKSIQKTSEQTRYNGTIEIEDKVGNKSFCPYDIDLSSASKITAKLTRTGINYTGTATSDKNIIAYAFSYSKDTPTKWTTVTGKASISISKEYSPQTTAKTLYFHVKNEDGKTTYAQVSMYKQCTTTKNSDSEEAKAYKFTYTKKNCTKNNKDLGTHNPYRKYDFKIYYCTCKIDKYNNKNCGLSSYKNMTMTKEGHNNTNYVAIFYQNSSNGVKACNADNKLNSYIYSVCNLDFTPFNSKNKNTVATYHGYKWYKYNSAKEEYHSFGAGWYHNAGNYDDRVSADSTVATACKKACANRF